MDRRRQVDEVAAEFAERWRGCPPIRVVDTPRDLPFPAPPDVEAAYRRGEAFLVASALDGERAAAVIAHEVVGHHGVRATLGAAWRSFLASTLAGSRQDPHLKATRQRIEAIYVADGGTVALPPMRLADEIAATIAERSIDPSTGRMAVARPIHKQAAAVAGHVAREVLLLDRPVDVNELEGVVLLAERQLRVGGRFFGWRRRWGRWYAGLMAHKFDPNARPMSLAESEDLLRGAKDQELWRENLFGTGLLVVLIGVPLLFIWALIEYFSSLGQFLRWLLH
ncbi:hypothetical protein [Roseateles chitosanitabidus]|uniref:hypothetical protein n=1 Tax=Roseateles chitosanitabidus TaxID=65048 RepID=UPI0011DEFFAF|nr:hypothetical protein [Roseateles chitosanitabidus]